MSFRDKVRENYAQATGEPREIVFEPWGLTVYVFPETVGQYAELLNYRTEPVEMALAVIRLRAKQRDGRPMFGMAEIDELRKKGVGKYGKENVLRLATEIQADREELRHLDGSALDQEAAGDDGEAEQGEA